MPEIKNTFIQGKMNKDLDERLIPNGQYKDAMNIQVTTSDGSDIGTVQNILGNKKVENLIPGSGLRCICSVADEKNDKIYWFLHGFYSPAQDGTGNLLDAIIEYHKDGAITPVVVDTKANTTEAVLNFPEKIITGVNIIDNLIFWTDNHSEPKKINIDRCKQGTKLDSSGNMTIHSNLVVDGEIATKNPVSVVADGSAAVSSTSLTLDDASNLEVGMILTYPVTVTYPISFTTSPLNTVIESINGNIVTLSSGLLWEDDEELVFSEPIDLKEEHIVVIKKKPTKAPTFKIITTEDETVDLLFEKTLPRFSCRYKYEDGEYSAFGPFTDVVFQSNYLGEYGKDNAYSQKESYNTGMVNIIKEIELTDFITPDMPEDVVQVDILYKQESSNVVFSIDSIKRKDEDINGNLVWEASGSNQDTDYNSNYKGYYKVETENIYAAVPANQLLRPWDNVPRKALAQEISGNRIVYGNYLQGYNFGVGPDGKSIRPDINADYKLMGTPDWDYGGAPSIKSLRNYQLGIIFGDKYGRETPVFTSRQGAFQLGWLDKDSNLSASNRYQLTASSASYFPEWADYYKIFVKETSGDYYNLAMDRAYTANKVSEELGEEDHIWISFNSSDRSKISEEDYIILKKQVGAEAGQIAEDNKFKIIDIKNEAPDSVKYVLVTIGAIPNAPISITTGTPPVGNETILNNTGGEGIFTNYLYRPKDGRDTLKFRKDNWLGNGGMELDKDKFLQEEIYFSFYTTDTDEYSKRYRVSTIDYETPFYTVKLKDSITETFAGEESTSGDPTTYFLDKDLVVRFERKAKRPLDSLSGRFYVKIASNALTSSTIEADLTSETVLQYAVVANMETYWYVDVQNRADSDPADGVINAQSPAITITGADTLNQVAGHSGAKLTKTESDWAALPQHTWFIDNMYFAAVQHGSSEYGQGLTSQSGPGIWSAQHFLKASYPWDMEPQFPGANGENMVNGMEGFIVTDDTHTAAGGIRRWRVSNTNIATDLTYGNTNGKFYLHLSFLAPGVALHDGTWGMGDNKLHPGYTPYSYTTLHKYFQNINARGNCHSATYGSGTAYPGDEYIEAWPQGYSSYTYAYFNYWNVYLKNTTTLWGNNDDYKNQWNPTYGITDPQKVIEINKILNGIHQKKRFKFLGDTTNTTYKIKSYKIKRLYNHTAWNPSYEWDGTTTNPTVGNGLIHTNSVVNKVWDWRRQVNGTIQPSYGTTGLGGAKETLMKDTIVNFGRANNRRVCYILELDKDPTDPLTNGGYNPFDWSSGSNTPNQPDANTPVSIQFVDLNYNIVGASEVKNPSIWETEPKQGVDLDIYYEASQAIPINIKEDNRELFAPVGSVIEFLDNPESKSGEFNVSNDIYLTEWNTNNGDNELYLSEEINSINSNGNNIDYSEKRIRFHRKDGSYTTAKILSMANNLLYDEQTNSYDSIKIISEIDPDAEVGLSWYNCLSFGNGLESDRIRDDFNAMTITNGVKASSTIEQPYQEERRKSGLIYSGLYNSTSGINDLNQFIMADKITKDLNPTYGGIQKLFSRVIRRSSSLIAFCEDRVVSIISNKDAIYNADGDPQIVASNAVLGDANAFVGDYGISKNPESFAKESYRAYFTDKQRGAVLRLSMDGITPISDAGMRDYFRDNLKTPTKLIGSYDEYKKEYNLTLSNYLPENIILDSSVDEGEELIEYNLPDSFVNNGNFTDGVDYTTPPQLSNVLLNSTFQTETNIVNHAEILEGQFQPEITGVPALPAVTIPMQSPVFEFNSDTEPSTTTKFNIYDWDKDTYTATNQKLLPTFEQNSGPGSGSNGTSSGGLVGGNPTGVQWYTGDDSKAYSYSASNTLRFNHAQNSSPKIHPELDVLQSDSNYTTTFNLNGVTTTTGYNVPSTFNTGHTEQGQVMYEAESIRTKHPEARDNTIFYGEEISIDFKMGDLGGNDECMPKIQLLDGDTLINTNIICTDFSGNEWYNSLHFTTTTGEPESGYTWDTDAKNNLWSGSSSTYYNSNKGFIGYGCTQVTWGPWYNPSSSQSNVTEWFRACFKFVHPGSDKTQTGIAIQDLKVKFMNAMSSNYDDFTLKAVRIKKRYRYLTPGAPEIAAGTVSNEIIAQPPVPSTTIPAWVEVDHSIDNWTSDGAPENWDMFEAAETNFGPQLQPQPQTATASYDQGSYVTGDTISWIIPDPNVTPTSSTPSFNQYVDGIQTSDGYADKHTIGTDGYLIQDLTTGSASLVGDNWYKLTCTYNGALTGDVLVDSVLDPGTTAGTTPERHLGVVGDDNVSLIMNDDGAGNLEARWKQSTDSGSNFDELKILGKDCTVVIDNVELFDISTPAGGGAISTFGNPNYWDLSGNMDMTNFYSYKNIYQQNGHVHWFDGGSLRAEPDGDDTQVDQTLSQTLGDFDDTNILPPTTDGYKLEFKISNYSSGQLEGYIYSGGAPDGNGGYIAKGFSFNGINANGDWSIIGNTDGTALSIKKDGVAMGNVTGETNITTQNDMNKIAFSATVDNANADNPFNGSISNIVVVDATNYFIAGDLNNWVINGFDKTISEYIVWNSTEKYIEFNNAPEESLVNGTLTPLTVRQNINRNFFEGETYSLKFNTKNYVGNGAIRGYFYNHLGKGFKFEVDSSNFTNSDSYYFNKKFIIGDDNSAVTDNSLLRGVFIIIVDSGPFTANLDNFVLQQEFPEFVPTTVTYSEDVKGWVSFKSFIPEGGLSVSNNYYTFRNGGLFQHHINDIRNWFYGDVDQNSNPKIVESSLTAIINQEPSLVKIFNTLNYEGSQSKVNKFITDAGTGLKNIEMYNLTDKNGWYVDYIKTNKQDGKLSEFVEKEGKWFNYIRGNNSIDTSALSFQGLGVVSFTV